jgi:hypothetical protein
MWRHPVSSDLCLLHHKPLQINSLVISLRSFPIDFETMARPAFGRRATCESSLSIDVREWHRQGLLRVGLPFACSWTRNSKPLGSIDVRNEADAVVLTFKESGEQRVPIVWTRCHLGGARAWFRCSASVGGRPCGRRVAKLYLRDAAVFACRQCCGLVYASQSENPRYRAISRVQKIRMRLGGSANLLEPFPKKPRGMHRLTYYRLFHKAMAAQERSIALDIDYLRRSYPGFLRC